MNTRLTIPYSVSYTRVDIYRTLYRLLFLISICYTFHRYLLQYGSALFALRNYQPTPFIWQSGKFVLIAGIMGLIFLMSKFQARIRAPLLAAYGLLAIAIIINVLSSYYYRQILTDEFEYQILALTLLPLALVDNTEIAFLKEEISGPLLNATQWILISSNVYVVANYFITGRLPIHAYEGITIRFGGLWDDPNAFSIFSVFLFVYAFRRGQYLAALLHVINIGLTLSLTGFILLTMAGLYLAYRRIRPLFFYPSLFFIGVITVFIVYLFWDAILYIYELKRQSIELHTNFDSEYYPLPLLQGMLFHETWWFSLLYNYSPFSIPVVGFAFWYAVKAFFIDAESIQRFYFILFVASSVFLPFIYMFPLNFLLLFFLVLYLKGIRF